MVSILNPTAKWSKQWCHTAAGRHLLCSALRKHKNLLINIVEDIYLKTQTKKKCYHQSIAGDAKLNEDFINNRYFNRMSSIDGRYTPEIRIENVINVTMPYDRTAKRKYIHSAPTLPTKKNFKWQTKEIKKFNSECLFDNIPKSVASQAKFCHNVSLVANLIQYRSGRSLFPLSTSFKKGFLTIQEIVSSVIEYIEKVNFTKEEMNSVGSTFFYKQHMIEVLQLLKNSSECSINYSKTSAANFERVKKAHPSL